MGKGAFEIDRDLGGLGVSYRRVLSAANSALFCPLDCFKPGMGDAPESRVDSEAGSEDVLADGFGVANERAEASGKTLFNGRKSF